MKIRRADKRYEPRHGGTKRDELRALAARIATAAALVAAVTVAIVTGILFRDDLITAGARLTGGGPAAMVVAGWCTVATAAAVAGACLWAAGRLRPRLLLLAMAAASAVTAFWFFPTRADKDPFAGEGTAFVTGGQTAWLSILVAAGAILFGDLADRRPAPRWVVLPVVVVSAVALTVAVAMAT